MSTSTVRPSYSVTEVAYGEERTITAVSLDGKRRYGARYRIEVDGQQVAIATWTGGRTYRISDEAFDVRESWTYITGDNGSVKDVARYMAYAHLAEVEYRARDAANEA